MDFLIKLFTTQGTASTLLYLTLTAFTGILIGKIEIKKVKLGIAGVLFTGLFFAHIGAKFEMETLHFIRELGLILFVYTIGIDVGPRFFASFKSEGLKLNILAAGIVVSGFAIAYGFYLLGWVRPAEVTGIMCGAVTNTPSLGAAQQALIEQGGEIAKTADLTAMGYAVAYPFGIVGIILTMILLRIFFKIKVDKEVKDYTEALDKQAHKLESVKIVVTNQNLFGKPISRIKQLVGDELVFSRICRNEEYLVAREEFVIQQGDIIFGVAPTECIEKLQLEMGEIEITKKKEISGNLAMFHVVVTNRKIKGKTIQQIGIYRRYEANITRIFRAGMEILPTLDTTVELGDTVRIVGKKDILNEVRAELGDSIKELAIPNTIPIFLGIFLGIILGSIPIFIPSLPAPAKLGLAGGPLLIAILLGYKGRIGKLDFYMTPGANMMLREVGIVLFLSCVGLSSGAKFVETVTHGGYRWMALGAAITFIPLMIIAVIGRFMKYNYLKICGLLAGSMTDPPALEFANSIAPVQAQSTAYASVYPLTMFLRVLLAQILILTTL